MFGGFNERMPQEQPKSQEKELTSFIQSSFSEQEIISGLERATSRSLNQLPTLFEKKIGSEYTYLVQGISFGGNVEHTLVFTLNNHHTKRSDAELEFEQDAENGVWDMRHRQVQTKDRGMSGSDFLKKAEEYFSILKQHKKINLKKFSAQASQPSVMQWLQKNGYHESAMNFEHLFDYEDGVFRPAPGYLLLAVKDPEAGSEKDPYLVRGEFLLDPEFKKLQQGLSFDLVDKQPFIEDINLLQDLKQKGYIPRLSYEKNVV